MNINEANFLKLLSASLFADRKLLSDFDNNLDWNKIFNESINQAVTGLVFEAIKYLPDDKRPSRDIYEIWEEESIISVMGNSAIMYAHKELLNIFDNNGIKCSIIKGASAAINYPKPDLRIMGDIDIFVNNKDFKKAQEILIEANYDLVDLGGQVGHEIKYYKNNICIELHNNIGGVPDGEIGERLYNILQNLPENSERANVGGIDFYKPNTAYNGLVLVLHIIHHLGEGVGFRQICDWTMFINNELTDEVWYNELLPILKENKIYYFTKVLTKTCCLYLSLPIEKCLWCKDVDENICNELIENIFENGNFGRKFESRAKSATMIVGNSTQKGKNGNKFLRIFGNLQNAGYSAWPLARKYKFFRLFAWAYVPLRFICRLFTGKRKFKELIIILKSAKERYPLMKKLKIFSDS